MMLLGFLLLGALMLAFAFAVVRWKVRGTP